MPYQTILVHAEAVPDADRRVATAAQVAERFEARLVGLGALAVTPLVSGAYVTGSGEVIDAMVERVREDLSEAEARFRCLARACPSLAWTIEEDYPSRALALHARGADLIVASRPDSKDGATYIAKPIELILQAGCPVLLVNEAGPPLSAASVVVAWKDTREARRALTDSLPFLQRATKVIILRVEESAKDESDSLSDVVARLARHGVEAAAETVKSGVRAGAASAIEVAADRHGADLIVAGAFSRSRVREWVLGGVTQDLIEGCGKFVLFSH